MVKATAELDLIFASVSPRRAELLRQLGLRFGVQPADIDETEVDGETHMSSFVD